MLRRAWGLSAEQSKNRYAPVVASWPTTSGSPPLFSISLSGNNFSGWATSFAWTLAHSSPGWRVMCFSKRVLNVPRRASRSLLVSSCRFSMARFCDFCPGMRSVSLPRRFITRVQDEGSRRRFSESLDDDVALGRIRDVARVVGGVMQGVELIGRWSGAREGDLRPQRDAAEGEAAGGVRLHDAG